MPSDAAYNLLLLTLLLLLALLPLLALLLLPILRLTPSLVRSAKCCLSTASPAALLLPRCVPT